MPTKRTYYLWLAAWALFYAGVLPYAVPMFLHWLSSPSDWWLGWGVVGLSVLAVGVALSIYQAARGLVRFLSHSSSTPPSSFNDRSSTKF
ncbi:hypothetical protein H8B13_19560 [Hymenobacter sp. BT188]|uniref:hypothetical protein n=1 Tax=Hymenobacter sp. BT188 TaxID=2763504 RepID=UPI001650F6A0|nr:hypothetical protein [Hymenobacter sp. BT188]MBC6609026.1 hypothetical protein [Hymenobacter sp. BT188]